MGFENNLFIFLSINSDASEWKCLYCFRQNTETKLNMGMSAGGRCHDIWHHAELTFTVKLPDRLTSKTRETYLRDCLVFWRSLHQVFDLFPNQKYITKHWEIRGKRSGCRPRTSIFSQFWEPLLKHLSCRKSWIRHWTNSQQYWRKLLRRNANDILSHNAKGRMTLCLYKNQLFYGSNFHNTNITKMPI